MYLLMSVMSSWKIKQSCHFGADQSTPEKFKSRQEFQKEALTNVLIFMGDMDAKFCTKHILKNTLLPFIHEEFHYGHRFKQDKDPKHTSRLAKQVMDQ